MKTAALITHSHPPAATEAVADRRRGRAARPAGGWSPTADEVAKHGAAATGVESVDALPREPDLCLVLGGDGSILYALRRFARTGVPVFGVNFGTVGFLAAVERDEPRRGSAAPSPARSRRSTCPGSRSTLDGEARVGLNDVTFTRRPHDRVAELSYRIAGEEVGHVRCDGLVAATPAGSTGYNLANQGPILAWGVEGYVVSYIAPHSLTARALVVAPDDVLHVGNAAGREPVDVAIDGEQVGELGAGRRARGPLRRRRRPAGPAAGLELLPAHPREVRPPRGLSRSPSRPARSLGLRPMERKWWTLVLVSIATFMLLLDITVVNVALPDIQRELDASLSSLQWVVDAYSLTLAAFLLTAARSATGSAAGGSSRSASAIFTFASFLCGIAERPDPAQPGPRPAGGRRRRRCSPPRWR